MPHSDDSYSAVAFYEVTEHNSFWAIFPSSIGSTREKVREGFAEKCRQRGEGLERRENTALGKDRKTKREEQATILTSILVNSAKI